MCNHLLLSLFRYVDEYAKTAGRPEFRGKDESDAIIGNPIQAFQLLKRLTVDWGDLQRKMSEDAWKSKFDLKIFQKQIAFFLSLFFSRREKKDELFI